MRIFSRTKSHIRQEPSVKLCTKKRDPKKTTIYNPPSWDVPLFRSPFVYQHLQEFFYSPKKTVLLEDLLYLITSDTISRINIKRLQAKPLVQIDNLSKWHTPILLLAFKQYGHITNDVYSFYIKPFIIGT